MAKLDLNILYVDWIYYGIHKDITVVGFTDAKGAIACISGVCGDCGAINNTEPILSSSIRPCPVAHTRVGLILILHFFTNTAFGWALSPVCAVVQEKVGTQIQSRY